MTADESLHFPQPKPELLPQNELKALFEGFDSAVKHPNQGRDVGVSTNHFDTKHIHELRLSKEESRYILEDQNASSLIVRVLDTSQLYGSEHMVEVECRLGQPADIEGATAQLVRQYSISKVVKHDMQEEYSVRKTPLGVIHTGQALRIIESDDEELPIPRPVLSDAERAICGALYEADTRVIPDDITILYRLRDALQP